MSIRYTKPNGSTDEPGHTRATSKAQPFTATITLSGDEIYTKVKDRLYTAQQGNNLSPLKQKIVRRHKQDRAWKPVQVTSDQFRCFADSFDTGIVFGVKFTHTAPPMYCAPTYDSTGEVHGHIRTGSVDNIDFSIYEEIVSVGYDPGGRYFYDKHCITRRLETADILVLRVDGSAVACRLKDGVIT